MAVVAAQQISQLMFCGDEVPAAVIDLGSSTCRFGTGGQDLPRHVFRSDVGLVEANSSGSSSSSSSSSSASSSGSSGSLSKRVTGDQALRYVRDDMDVSRPFTEDGNVSINWDNVEALMEHGLSRCMKINPSEYSMLLAESRFEDTESKKKVFEICFEKFSTPAAYMSANASLSSFSAGRPTSYVMDFGASGIRLSPLIDGYVLKRAEMRTRRGGDWLDSIVMRELQQAYPQNIKPWFETDGKTYPTPRSSFRNMHVKDVVSDVKRWMCFVPYNPVTLDTRQKFIYETITLPPYELPDGTVVKHFDALCTGPEQWFVRDYASVSQDGVVTSSPTTQFFDFHKKADTKVLASLPAHCQTFDVNPEEATLQELAMTALMKCDVDARKDILSNVLLVGGASNIDGISNRLSLELSSYLPSSMKMRINSQLANERQHAAWIGGSILSICGSFQQMWITKHEYQEYGPNIIAMRL